MFSQLQRRLLKDHAFHVILASLITLLSSCTQESTPPPSLSPLDPNLLSGKNALEETRRFVELGPRVSGTAGAEKAAGYLAEKLMDFGLQPVVDTFVDATPAGSNTFRNVIASINGTSGQSIVLVSHYDTKGGIADDFAGANDSGSSTGLLLALAKALSRQTSSYYTTHLVFVDGEECAKHYAPQDGLHGSRRMVRWLEQNGGISRVRAAIILDMIGDRDLTVTLPANNTSELAAKVLLASRDAGVRDHFSLARRHILDDHVPFLDAGIPAVDIIDFEFGSAPGKNDYWHTPDDTMDKLSPESLESVGRVVIHLLNRLAIEE